MQSFGFIEEVSATDDMPWKEVDEFARNQWEGILGYIVGTPILADATAKTPSSGVKELLRIGHLVTVAAHGSPKITKEGFAFVLQDTNTQLWTFLFLYTANAEALGMTKVEVLSFLFQVSSQFGLAYSKANLTSNELRILSDFGEFGLIYQRSSAAPYFFPTRLAASLTSDTSSLWGTTPSSSDVSRDNKGFIIVESNYRVYAYTTSPLQISLLSLFVNLRSRHPNLVSGKISKASV